MRKKKAMQVLTRTRKLISIGLHLNVKYFQLHIVRAEKPKLNDHKFGSFFLNSEFARNEGRSDPCPNTLIWSGLTSNKFILNYVILFKPTSCNKN